MRKDNILEDRQNTIEPEGMENRQRTTDPEDVLTPNSPEEMIGQEKSGSRIRTRKSEARSNIFAEESTRSEKSVDCTRSKQGWFAIKFNLIFIKLIYPWASN